MKKAFFEDSAMAMAKLIVESIYHGMEENEGVYADLMYSNGKGQHGWAHIFQNEHEHLTKAGYRVVLMVSGSWQIHDLKNAHRHFAPHIGKHRV